MSKDVHTSVYCGNKLRIEVFGASHEQEIGVRVKGLQGKSVDLDNLQAFVDRRKAKKASFSTSRLEEDKIIVKKGLKGDKLKNDFIAVIKNCNQKSLDYQNVKKIPRPSHADYVGWVKYGNDFDYRGGGKFSGRMTAPLCIVGGICKQILSSMGIEIHAYIASIGSVQAKGYMDLDESTCDYSVLDGEFPLLDTDKKEEMLSLIDSAKKDGDSIGGTVECLALNVPLGLGEFMFDSVEGVISKLAFSVPAVKGIEFGKGFSLSQMNGSVANDTYFYDNNEKVRVKTNNNGGILGGITTGNPISFKVAIKPTPSIAKEQDSVDLENKQNVKLKIKGRHDACIVPRAVPVIEAIMAIAIYDLI